MSIDSPSLSLDILGAKNDVHATNCVLRENQTNLLGRGSLSYILSVRNETLRNKSYRVPEDWDHSWTKSLGPIWTPASLPDSAAHLQTWLTPEHYRPEETAPTRCTAVTNRANSGTLQWVQNVEASMPLFEKNELLRNHEGLNFDGSRTSMRGSATNEWTVGNKDFILAVVVTPLDSNDSAVIASKKNDANFSLHYDSTGLNKSFIFYMNGVSVSTTREGSNNVVTCGRIGGKPFISNNGETRAEGLIDTTDLSSLWKPYIGDQAGVANEYLGRLHEVVFVNDNLVAAHASSVSDASIAQIEGYLSNKYNIRAGLPSTHTYKNSPPRASIRKES